jgi:single-strand DNA-binding protein
MAGETVITIIGNLTADPELRFTPSGAAVANFTVASTPRTFDKDTNGWKDGDTLFLRCAVWRDAAENVAESLQRGTRVLVSGRLKQRSYEKDGAKHTVVEMDVDEVGPSLKYATAKVNKTQRGGGGGGFNSGGQGGGQGAGQGGSAGGQGAGNDPWATGSPAPANAGGGQSPGWGNAPSYDEPPF